jgi:hypothetical protein
MKRVSAALALFCALLCGAVLLHCGGSEVVGHGGSEVVGKLVKIINNKDTVPAPGAKVYVYKDSFSIKTKQPDTGTTDKNGAFVVHVDTSGNYFLYGQDIKDTLVALFPIKIDSVAPDKKESYSFSAGTHLLLPPGSVSGRVTVYSGDNGLILVDIPGLSYGTSTNDSGNFTILNIPPGKYVIRYSKDNFIPYTTDSIKVSSGKDTVLQAVELTLDPTKPPPPPTWLTATPNTQNGTVILRWNSVPDSILYGYILYRNKTGSPLADSVLDTIKKPDTSYVDTVYLSSINAVPSTIIYTIASLIPSNTGNRLSPTISVNVVPPSTVKPFFSTVPKDTSVDYNGTDSALCQVLCGVSFKLFLAQPGSQSWTEIPCDSNGKAHITFTTGASSSWGKVTLMAESAADTVDTSFIVKVRPRPVTIVSVDSTDSSVTVKWNRSPDNDFHSYQLFYRAFGKTSDSVIIIPDVTDTFLTVKTLVNGSGRFSVDVTDTEKLTSALSPTKTVGIKNTPPRFTSDTSTMPDSAKVGNNYGFTLSASDKNSDAVSYSPTAPAGAIVQNGLISWTPTINQRGKQQIVVVAKDGFGGTDTLRKNVFVVGDIWQTGVPLNLPRSQFGIASVEGQIFAIGGIGQSTVTANESPLATMVCFDSTTPSPTSWTLKTLMKYPREAPMVAVWNDTIFVLGGFNNSTYSVPAIEEYIPSGNTWQVLPTQMPFQRSNGAACVIGNNLYCIGGMVPQPDNPGFFAVKAINVFNLTTRKWTKGPDMHFSRAYHNAIVYNGKIYIAGGVGGAADSTPTDSSILGSVEVFDPSSNQCSLLASPITPRCYFGIAAIGSSLYFIGGFSSLTDDNGFLSTVERLDVVTGLVDRRASLPEPRFNLQAIQNKGLIYCIGGVMSTEDGAPSTTSVTVYYP